MGQARPLFFKFRPTKKKLSILSSILAFYFPSREERNAAIHVTTAEVPVFAI